jgi:hypothetical protein
MKKWTILFLFFRLCFSIHGQQIQNPFELIRGERKIIYGLDNRRTHVHGENTVIYGIYSGVGFSEKKLRFKIGLSGAPFEVGQTIGEDGAIKQNRFVFFNIGEELDFWIVNKFRMSTYFQVGYGFNYYTLIDPNSNLEIESGRNKLIPLELGLQCSYDLLTWFSFRFGAGWRFVFPNESSDLSGYYLKTGLQLNPKELCLAYKKWKFERNHSE